jgi:hypothetical protein
MSLHLSFFICKQGALVPINTSLTGAMKMKQADVCTVPAQSRVWECLPLWLSFQCSGPTQTAFLQLYNILSGKAYSILHTTKEKFFQLELQDAS